MLTTSFFLRHASFYKLLSSSNVERSFKVGVHSDRFFQDIGRATAESHSEMLEGPLLNHRDVGGATAETQRFLRGHYLITDMLEGPLLNHRDVGRVTA